MTKVNLTTHVESELRDRLAQRATALGLPLSEVVRQALVFYLDCGAPLLDATAALRQAAERQREIDDRITVIADFIAEHAGGDPAA